jgi:DNA-binding transcriptional LysR family regulator
MLELGHLRHFWSVARAGGFSSAARVVHVRQPGLSRAVKQLEGALGVVLFEREKRGVRLTKVGKEIFDACERIFREVENVQTLADAERTDCRGVLRVAMSSELTADLLPAVLARYHRSYPDVWPMIFSGPAAPMLDAIVRGESELGLFFHVPREREGLADTLFARVPFKLVIRADRARDRTVRASFIGSREIDDQGTRQYPTLDRLRRDLPDARIRISANDATARKRFVLEGLGVAILPTFMVEEDLAAGALTELLREERFRFDLRLVARAGHVLTRAAKMLLEEIRGALRP